MLSCSSVLFSPPNAGEFQARRRIQPTRHARIGLRRESGHIESLRRSEALKVDHVPRIAGALLFQPAPHVDERGFFSRTFDAQVMRSAGIDPAAFAQDSISRSRLGVVRGLHIRRGVGEAKLVRCSYGAIFDVVVDLRPTSPTYRNWESFELRDDEQISVYIPAGCAHGFQALTDPADVSYRIDRPHDPSEDVSIAFDDPELAISWPLPVSIMSQRDRVAPSLAVATKLLTILLGGQRITGDRERLRHAAGRADLKAEVDLTDRRAGGHQAPGLQVSQHCQYVYSA